MDATNKAKPLAPATVPSVQEQLAMYRAFYHQEIEEAKKDNLFAPDVNKETPVEKSVENEQWLDPVSVDTSPIDAIDIHGNSDAFKHFQEKFESDEAVQEIAEPMMEVAYQLRQAIESGQMTYEQAMQEAVKLMDSHVTPVLDKYHGDRAKSRTLLSRTPAEVAKSFGAEVKQYADGKGVKPVSKI